MQLGVAVLKEFDVFPNKNWYWIGVAALVGFVVLFNVLFTVSLIYLSRMFKNLMSNIPFTQNPPPPPAQNK